MKELNATVLTISLEIVKNNICLEGARKQNALFSKLCPKRRTHASNVCNRPCPALKKVISLTHFSSVLHLAQNTQEWTK